jgi:hypothetical protein
MPMILDMIQAAPSCRRRRMKRNGQHATHYTCFGSMRYSSLNNVWICKQCGKEALGVDPSVQNVAA